jgi:hypothetical protein
LGRANQLVANPFDGRVEADMVQHMNQDHADTFALYCQQANIVISERMQLLQMVGIDSTGFHLRVDEKIVYIAFPQPVIHPQQVREVLVAMLKSARKQEWSESMSFLLLLVLLLLIVMASIWFGKMVGGWMLLLWFVMAFS